MGVVVVVVASGRGRGRWRWGGRRWGVVPVDFAFVELVGGVAEGTEDEDYIWGRRREGVSKWGK